MKEIDMNKLNVAIQYIRRMSEGNNPVNNQKIEDSILENANVVRCLFFVADVLEQVYKNGGIGGKKSNRKERKEKFSYAILEQFRYVEDKPISRLVRQMNTPIEETNIKKIKYTSITKALKEEGYLVEMYNEEVGKNIVIPSSKGQGIGIYSVRRVGSKGNVYYVVMYNEKAQNFLKENLEQLLINED